MTRLDPDFTPDPKSLCYLPLGGVQEFGANISLYAVAGQWLVVDCGMGFTENAVPGVDIYVPDPAFLKARRDQIAGLVITHAHEDHVGAVEHMWPHLQVPIWATRFTAAFLRRKLAEQPWSRTVEINILEPGKKVEIGPFALTPIPVTHSVPDTVMLVIDTPEGRVLHTGDWKLDPAPEIGRPTDVEALRALGDGNLLALVGDSTNAVMPGVPGSEADVAAGFRQIFAERRGRIAVACFSSNVARMKSAALAARSAGRHIALAGRSLWRCHDAARECGLLEGLDFLKENEAADIHPDELVVVCTGSQGEPRAALTRIADQTHPNIQLERGDTVIFSARPIPGNEKSIIGLENAFARRGVRILTPSDAPVHVSGHARREEMAELYQWTRPRIAVPVHGEYQNLQAHAEIARGCQVPHVLVPKNGTVLRLAPGTPAEIAEVPAHMLGLDGGRLVPLDGVAIAERRRMMWNGAISCAIVLDKKGSLLADPSIAVQGIDDTETDAAIDQVLDAVEALSDRQARDDDLVREAARLALRRHYRDQFDKKPVIDVHLVRV